MTKSLHARKVLQIVFVYAAALLAATACGSFKPMNNSTTIGAGGLARDPSFNVRVAEAYKTSFNSSLVVSYTVVDGNATFSIATGRNAGVGGAAVQTATNGQYTYQLKDYCLDVDCATLAVIVGRADNNNKTEGQSTALMTSGSAANSQLQVVKTLTNTSFVDAQSALTSLSDQTYQPYDTNRTY